jgi:hypothetical protein
MSGEELSDALSAFSAAEVLRQPRLGSKTFQELKTVVNKHGRDFAVSTPFVRTGLLIVTVAQQLAPLAA